MDMHRATCKGDDAARKKEDKEKKLFVKLCNKEGRANVRFQA